MQRQLKRIQSKSFKGMILETNKYTVDPIYRGAWGPSSASAIYPDRDISHGGSLSRRR